MWLTPHIMEDIPNTTAHLRERFRELQDAYKGNVILHLAAENMLDSLFDERLEKMASFLLERTVTTSWWKPVTSIRRWDCGTYSCV